MWRYRWPTVESAPYDADALVGAADDELHPPVEPAELVWSGGRRRAGAVEEGFSFPSPIAAGDEHLRTVYGVRWRKPGDARPRRPGSALVVVHGAFAASWAKVRLFLPPPGEAEWDTFLVELPHHMRRQRADSKYSGQLMVSANVPRLVRAVLRSEAEARALVLGLRRAGYERIVLAGLSLGANAVLQAVLRVPVNGVVAIVPAVNACASLWESVLGEALRPAAQAAGFTDETVRRALRLITPLHMGQPVMDGRRTLFVYGENDLLCPPAPIEDLRRAWGSPGWRLETGHATFVLRFWTVRRIVAAWTRAVAGCPRAPSGA